MTDTAQACGNCKYWDRTVVDTLGLCRHPITNLLRDLVRDGDIPAAFGELEVTTMTNLAGKYCPTWTAK